MSRSNLFIVLQRSERRAQTYKSHFITCCVIHSLPGWLFGILLITLGVMNMLWVHPVPGLAYLLLSALYLPPTYNLLKIKLGFPTPIAIKVILGIAILWFTAGISDLGEILGF